MLNISKDKISSGRLHEKKFGAFGQVTNTKTARHLTYWLIGILGIMFIMLFMPWTQNIRTHGYLTTLKPEDRPQEIHSIIDGRIEKWYIREGDTVKAGDTIALLSEIKDQYWGPKLLDRTNEQINAKEGMKSSYENKVEFLENQKNTEKKNLQLKLKQTKNKVVINRQKVTIDSAEVEASKVAYKIATDQYARAEKMYEEQGIISLKDLEDRKNKLNSAMAKLIASENKYANAQQDLINATIELNSVEADYYSKIFKIESEIQSAISDLFKTEEDIAKLRNQYSNYSIRSGNWYITAPKDGQIVKVQKGGIGETIKAGDAIATITSLKPTLAVELYVNPVDMPLMRLNKKVRVVFDGWPAIIFSGWPGASYGTFGGRVAAIDSDISPNGKYRILVAPGPSTEPWPEQLRVGAGANGIALLNNVPVWYEIWRKVNGFPPDFYQPEEKSTKEKKDKKKL